MKKTIIYFVVISILLLIGYGIYFFNTFSIIKTLSQPHYASLLRIGYNDQEINAIEKLDEAYINEIIKVSYHKDILKIIKEKYFLLSNLGRYINNYDKYANYIEIVNTNRDYDYYTNTLEVDLLKNNLILVNKYHYLKSDYIPSNLVSAYKGYGYLTNDANEALIDMYEAARLKGLTLYAQSTYRSYQLQETLYNRYLEKDGVVEADTYSARPGFSEHQTGLAIDFMIPGETLDTFHLSSEFTWLKNNSYKYGYILRYPSDKEDITGYTYEAWHYRYVGKEVATYIYENNITFDEYYAYFIK